MTSFRVALLAALCSIFLASCGDTFRPIAIPVPVNVPPGQASKTAEVITGTAAGTVTNYNLSGATITGQATIGQGPAAALLVGGATVVANQTDNTLSVVSAVTPQNGTPTTITLDPGASPSALALGVSSTVYVAYNALNAVGIVSNGTVIGAIALNSNGFTGSGPAVMLTDSLGTKLFVGNVGSNNVSIIDLTSNTVVATVPCAHPSGMARTPDAPYVYVTCRDSNNVLILNANTKVADYDFPVGAAPVSATFDPARKRLIVTSSGSNTVTFFEENFSLPLASQHVQTIVPVSGPPIASTPLPDGSRVYVALSNGTVTVIDAGVLTVRTNIAVGGQPQAIVASTDSTRVAVTTAAPDTLQVIDTTLDQLNTSHALPGPPKALIIF
jgi:YVTN family beta-propeller protein